MSEAWVLHLENDPQAAVEEAAQVLGKGGVVVFPTDTVYGLLGSSKSEVAYREIYRIKGRDFQKPLALLIYREDEAFEEILVRAYSSYKEERFNVKKLDASEQLGLDFIAGAATIVVWPHQIGTEYSLEVATIQPGSVGIRCPNHPDLQWLIREAGWLWATSVNRSGQPPATTADEVLAWLDELRERGIEPPELVVLSRTPGSGKPSSVIDLTGDEPKRLR